MRVEFEEIHKILSKGYLFAPVLITKSKKSYLSWKDFFKQKDFTSFRNILKKVGYKNYTLEFVTTTTSNKIGLLLVLYRIRLPDRSNHKPFKEYLKKRCKVVSFLNLGKDCVLVVPCNTSKNYATIKYFVDNSTKAEFDTLLHKVSNSITPQTKWISTHGYGVVD